MKNVSQILVSQLALAGEIIKLKYKDGINISLYFMGTENDEIGLVKIHDLFYRGDNIVTTRAPRSFYSFNSDGIVVVEAAKTKTPVFKDVTNNPINSKLSWVYAYPILNFQNEVLTIICFSGSAREINQEFQKDLFTTAVALSKNLNLIFEECDIPNIWKDNILKL